MMKKLFVFFMSISAFAQSGAGLSAGVPDDKPIEVRGQSRNLNMLLKLQNEREAIDFIKLRKHYKKEIKSQSF